MSRNTFLTIISLIIFQLAHGQAKITVGQPYQVIDADAKYYFAHKGDIITLKMMKRSIVLQRLNATTLKFVQTRMFEDFPKGYQIEKVTEFNNRFYLFYSYWEDEKELLFAREIDIATCTLKPAKKIITVDEKITGNLVKTGWMSAGIADKYSFYFSHDSTSMLVQYRVRPDKKDDSKSFDVIGMHVFTPDLTEKWGGKVTMPYTEKKMDNLDYSLDSKGNAYIVTRVYNDDSTDKKKRGEEDANYKLEILKIVNHKTPVSSAKVEPGDKFIKNIWLYESPGGGMVAAGYYNIGKKANNVDGILMFKLDASGKPSALNTYEIPVEILNQYATGKNKRKNERKEDDDEAEATNMVLRDIYVHKDGSVLLAGEQYFEKVHSSYANGRSSTYSTYHYNDILVAKIDAAGKLAWMRKLPKRQEGGGGRGGMSYAFINDKDNFNFVFLDNEKNKDLPLTELPARHVDSMGGFLTSYNLDSKTGTVKKVTLLDTRNVNGMEVFQFNSDRIVGTAKNTFVCEVYKKKKEDVLIKVELTGSTKP
jgi:hypothetical protein